MNTTKKKPPKKGGKKPKGLTPKQEAFALAVAKGMSQADAYRSAYDAVNCTDKTIQEKASHLMAGDKIAARVDEMRAAIITKAAEGIAYEYEDAMRELDEAINFAKANGASGPYVAALNLKQKISGLHVEERKNDRSPVGDWPPDRVKAALEGLAAIRRAKQTQRA